MALIVLGVAKHASFVVVRRVCAVWLFGLAACGKAAAPETSPEPTVTPSEHAAAGTTEPVSTRSAWGEPSAVADSRVVPSATTLAANLAGPDWHAAATVAWRMEPEVRFGGVAPELGGAAAEVERLLWAHYALATDGPTADALLFAIGRTGGSRSVGWMRVELEPLPSSTTAPRTAASLRALALLCARGYSLDEGALVAVERGLMALDSDVRQASAYTLYRCARTSAELFAADEVRKRVRDRLAALLQTNHHESQRLAWQALAGIGEIPTAVPEAILSDTPLPWTIEVEAVRALARHPDGRTQLVERLEAFSPSTWDLGPRFHVLIEALRGLRGHPARLETFEARARQAPVDADAPAARGLAWVRCELRWRTAWTERTPESVIGCAPEDQLDADLQAMLAVDVVSTLLREGPTKPLLDTLFGFVDDPRPAVAAYALSMLAEVDDPRASVRLRQALRADDPGRVSAATGAVAARAADRAKRDVEAIPVLLELASANDASAGDLEARAAAVDALGRFYVDADRNVQSVASPDTVGDALERLLDDPALAIRRASLHALAFDEVRQARARVRFDEIPDPGNSLDSALRTPPEPVNDKDRTAPIGLRVHTDAGEFTISFDGVPAPRNHANLVELARAGAFEGTRWHRIVPDFVAQGGDPRGDGYGGPGYAVPCEWSNLHYVRGAIGMAHAGRDTAGSQFFVTHSPQPHLDGRYTLVGFVDDEQGMTVADRLLVGDRIQRVDVITSR